MHITQTQHPATLRVQIDKALNMMTLLQAGWLILESFPEHVDVLAFMNAIADLFGEL